MENHKRRYCSHYCYMNGSTRWKDIWRRVSEADCVEIGGWKMAESLTTEGLLFLYTTATNPAFQSISLSIHYLAYKLLHCVYIFIRPYYHVSKEFEYQTKSFHHKKHLHIAQVHVSYWNKSRINRPRFLTCIVS